MRWTLLVVIALLAASCSSSGSSTEQIEPVATVSVEAAAPTPTPFELLPDQADSVPTVRQRTVFIESTLVASDNELAVVFVGGPEGYLADDPCAGEYEIDVVESPEQIQLTVHELALTEPDPDQTCVAAGHQRSVTVALDAPLDARVVVDGMDNTARTVLDPAAFLWPANLPDGWVTGFREVADAALTSRYGAEQNPSDGVVLLAGLIDNDIWNMAAATTEPATTVVASQARAAGGGSASLIRSDTGQLTIAFEEGDIHYRATARGAVTEVMLSAFVTDLAFDPDARSLAIPFNLAPPPPGEQAPNPLPTPTATAPDPDFAWSASESTRDVANYLEALRQGAYEQAAWPAYGNGVLFEGQSADETGADFLARMCSGSLCNGPYLVRGQAGTVSPVTSQSLASVTVAHLEAGERSSILLLTFEGQRLIGSLPPLVEGQNDASLRRSLFGDSPPQHVVVERFDAFEIWDGPSTIWVTNWHAADAVQIEGDVVATWDGLFGVTDAQQVVNEGCSRLMERDGQVLVLDWCGRDPWEFSNLSTGAALEPPIPYEAPSDGSSPWFDERGGSVLIGQNNVHGRVKELRTLDGTDLSGEDSPGQVVISVDGTHVAYVDRRPPAAISPHWSPVVVVREIANGDEVGRWELNGSVLCLEFAVDWIIACEADDNTLTARHPDQDALVAINPFTGELNRVTTGTQVFLPSIPPQS